MKVRKYKKRHYSKFCLPSLCYARGCCTSLEVKRYNFRNYSNWFHNSPVVHTGKVTKIWEL